MLTLDFRPTAQAAANAPGAGAQAAALARTVGRQVAGRPVDGVRVRVCRADRPGAPVAAYVFARDAAGRWMPRTS